MLVLAFGGAGMTAVGTCPGKSRLTVIMQRQQQGRMLRNGCLDFMAAAASRSCRS